MTTAPSSDGQPVPPAQDLTALLGDDQQARCRTWPRRPDIALLTLNDHTRAPSNQVLRGWIAGLHDAGFDVIRTGALASTPENRFEREGFTVIQRLVLLRLGFDDIRLDRPALKRRTMKSPADIAVAADLDVAAFGPDWGMDAASISDACTATPSHRARFALNAAGDPVGFAITGRSSKAGFIQRLAIHPDSHRLGAGRALVLDSLRWLRTWRAHTVMVNTNSTNHAALALYDSMGFERLDDELVVMELDMTNADAPDSAAG